MQLSKRQAVSSKFQKTDTDEQVATGWLREKCLWVTIIRSKLAISPGMVLKKPASSEGRNADEAKTMSSDWISI